MTYRISFQNFIYQLAVLIKKTNSTEIFPYINLCHFIGFSEEQKKVTKQIDVIAHKIKLHKSFENFETNQKTINFRAIETILAIN